MTQLVRVEIIPEEHYDYFIDGVRVASATYNEHGRSGLALAYEMFEAFAGHLNTPIYHAENFGLEVEWEQQRD